MQPIQSEVRADLALSVDVFPGNTEYTPNSARIERDQSWVGAKPP